MTTYDEIFDCEPTSAELEAIERERLDFHDDFTVDFFDDFTVDF